MKKNNAALFLDRDGVLIKDSGYVGRVEDVELIEDIIPALQWTTSQNIPIIVLTNQSGVARGMFKLEDCHKIHQHIQKLLAEKNITILDWYICPHHPTEGIGEYKKLCRCRKPAPQMAIDAARDHQLDLRCSLMVGDKISDDLDIDDLSTVFVKGRYPQDGIDPLEHTELLTYLKMFFSKSTNE
jgi:D-glycero-D-manno-heptose 1,7-bisphosphate phosphatase